MAYKHSFGYNGEVVRTKGYNRPAAMATVGEDILVGRLDRGGKGKHCGVQVEDMKLVISGYDCKSIKPPSNI